MKPIDFNFNNLNYESNIDIKEITKNYLEENYEGYNYNLIHYNLIHYNVSLYSNNSYIKLQVWDPRMLFDDELEGDELDKIKTDIIDIAKEQMKSEEQDEGNQQAFQQFLQANKIESNVDLSDFNYYNDNKDPNNYIQITSNLFDDLYVDLPELQEHTREIFDDGTLKQSEKFYTFY